MLFYTNAYCAERQAHTIDEVLMMVKVKTPAIKMTIKMKRPKPPGKAGARKGAKKR